MGGRRFSVEERALAVREYFACGMNAREASRRLGWPSRRALCDWARADARFRPHMGGPRLPLRVREGAVLAYRGGMSLRAAARRYGVSDASVARWAREWDAPPAGGPGQEGCRMDLDDSLLPDDPEELKAIIRGQRLENDVLREVVALVKKDPAADPRRLTNREKTLIADRLRPTHSLTSLASRLHLALSSYHYHHARMGRDKHAWLRPLVHEIFGQAKGRYGSRRIHATLRAGGTRVSEKVVRRVMAQEGLKARSSRKPRRYSSYAGECSPAPDNLIRRDFHAREPDQKWLTDITEIKARDGKIYLSPVLDCFDGRIVSYSVGRHPDAELANSSLRKAIATLGADARPIVHSDRGGHYRWPEWISIMQERRLTRSMSAKGCSPDNSAMEGFFGRMKTEATYPEHWERLTCAQAIARTKEYIAWYNSERIKKSLGYRSPDQHRRAHGLMA